MLYFKNVELAEKYHVSEGSVRNWLKEAEQGKINLELYKKGNRQYVANTTSNLAVIDALIEKRKKYRNTKSIKNISPKAEFYKLYSQEQIYDILTNLEKYHEIPRQYNYFDGGAKHWDEYTQRLATEEQSNMINSTQKLLNGNLGYLDDLLADYDRVNIVDIGPGNAYPVKRILEHLVKRKRLGRYIALDISPPMLEIAERNIQTWFGSDVTFEGHKLDINYDRFSQLLTGEYIKKDSNRTANLILLLGGTLCNERVPDGAFKVIHDSMGVNDFLVHTQKLDSDATRQYFDFNIDLVGSEPAPIHRLVLDLLNIDKTMYDLELGFDESRGQRFEKIRFNIAVTIRFEFDDGLRDIQFNKNDAILIWRSWQQRAMDVVHQFDRNNFYLLHTSQTQDQEYMLTVAQSV